MTRTRLHFAALLAPLCLAAPATAEIRDCVITVDCYAKIDDYPANGPSFPSQTVSITRPGAAASVTYTDPRLFPPLGIYADVTDTSDMSPSAITFGAIAHVGANYPSLRNWPSIELTHTAVFGVSTAAYYTLDANVAFAAELGTAEFTLKADGRTVRSGQVDRGTRPGIATFGDYHSLDAATAIVGPLELLLQPGITYELAYDAWAGSRSYTATTALSMDAHLTFIRNAAIPEPAALALLAAPLALVRRRR